MRKFALLCPGQGGQNEHLFSFARNDETATTFIDQIEMQQGFGRPLQELLNAPDLMFDNQFAQPLITAATLANWLALHSHLPKPELIAGYSIGEVAAHAISGEISAEQAVTLARCRAQAMQACIDPARAQGMLAVTGLRLDALQRCCLEHRLDLAIITGETNAIIAGLRSDVDRAEQALRSHPSGQLHLSVLPVHIASHTPLMTAAIPSLSAALDQLAWQAPEVPVIAGINAMKMLDNMGSKQSLLAQMTQTIRWHECMDAYHEAGINVVLELGPGAALSRMLQARHPHIACRSVADFRSRSAAAEWVSRQMQAD